MENPRATFTQLLAAHRAGETAALDGLVEEAYGDLRAIAHRQRLSRPSAAFAAGDLHTTALVNELYVKIAGGKGTWRDRAHFLASCATAIRHILVDAARRAQRQKRGDGERPMPLEDRAFGVEKDPGLLMQIDHALQSLARHDQRLVRVFECRYFGGLSSQETADALDLTLRTAQRDWQRARLWLRQALRETEGETQSPAESQDQA